jgi:lauroyl/myristoyl acyltransferase
MWIALDSSDRHAIRVLPALETPPAPDARAALLGTVRAWHEVLERAIAEHPEQWVWHHRRWKSAPPPDFKKRWRNDSHPVRLQGSREAVIAR